MYLKHNGVRLFDSHFIKEIDGMRILFIGVLTEDVLYAAMAEGLIGALIDIEDAATEVGRVCDAYRNEDIDFCVLLTHIGFEEDKKLAAKLDPAWGVDVIIGGHSHTLLDEPCVVAGIPIVQSAVGTDQIGRFDIMVDTDNNRIDSCTWQCIPITDSTCPTDPELEHLISEYEEYTNDIHGRVLTRFLRNYTHPDRYMETELGDLFAECFRDQLGVDLMLLGSGSIRQPRLGPIVTLRDFKTIFPFGGPLIKVMLTGPQLRHAVAFMLRDEAIMGGDHTEWYQFSKGFFCEYDKQTHTVVTLKMNGKEVSDDDLFSVALQIYHYMGMDKLLDLSHEDVEKNGAATQIASDSLNVLEEYFITHPLIELDKAFRLLIRGQRRGSRKRGMARGCKMLRGIVPSCSPALFSLLVKPQETSGCLPRRSAERAWMPQQANDSSSVSRVSGSNRRVPSAYHVTSTVAHEKRSEKRQILSLHRVSDKKRRWPHHLWVLKLEGMSSERGCLARTRSLETAWIRRASFQQCNYSSN